MNLPPVDINQALSRLMCKQQSMTQGHEAPTPFGQIFFQNLSKKALHGDDQMTQAMRAQIREGRDFPLVDSIKRSLLSQGLSSNKISIGKKGLDAFQKLLLDLGFDCQQVQDLVRDLKDRFEFKDITLADLFKSAEQLAQKGLQEDSFLDTSAVPFVEGILTELNLPVDQITRVMNQAGTNGQGINLPNLLNALKQVQNQIPSDQMAPADPASRQQVMEMMNRIGIPVDPNSAEPLNLEQLISKIERMVALGHRPAADENTLLRDLYQFITNLKPSARGTDTKDVTVVADDEGLASSGPSLNIRKPGLSPQQQQLLDSMSADQKPSNAKNEFQPSYMKPAEDQLELDRMEIQGLKADTGWEKTISKQAVGDLLIGGAGRSETASTQSQTLVSGTKLPGYVLNQVGSQILKARLNNENEVTLQLKPPHLGRIFMTIENQMDGLKVSVITEQQAAREMLQSHMHELRSLLNEQGLRLEKLDVELSQNFEQTMTSARQGHNRRKERRRGSAANIVKKNTISAAEALAPKNGVNEGVLHLLA